MDPITILLILLALAAVIYISYNLGYTRGHFQGIREYDELLSKTIDPLLEPKKEK